MTAKKHREQPELSRLERAVMGVIWDLGECTSAQIIVVFQQKRNLADATIRTVIRKLHEKGYIEQVPSMERALCFRPCAEREAVAWRNIRDLVRDLYGGVAHRAVTCMLKHEKMSAEEFNAIRRMLEERQGADDL
jgi:predicted transcriptional regulator